MAGLRRRSFQAAALAAVGGLGACTNLLDVLRGSTPAAAPGDGGGGLAGADSGGAGPPAVMPPAPAETTVAAALPPVEFRAAWVATVDNIDWPSRRDLSAAAQRAEVRALLDQAVAIGLNAIVLQVRPAADAIYPSTLEPWSEYLTGRQGRPPDDGYDPLAYWLAQAHQRGLALHAWFNPYRARQPSARGPLAANHVAYAQPALVKAYGKQLWLDPGEPRAAEHTLAVVADVLRRYEVDGIHIDDYFYPYPVNTGTGAAAVELPFPDEPSWQAYRQGGGTLARDDWRRDNVDRLVQAMFALVRRERPGVLFGISPFGLGRPDRRPPGIRGFSQYDKLYADVERWCEQGWCDYLAPQLYWAIDQAPQAFGVLLDYWLAQARPGMAVWPGLFTSRIGAPRNAWGADEVLRQVALLRERAGQGAAAGRPEPSGHIHFSMAALMQDRDGIASRLRAGPYAQPAAPVATRPGLKAPTTP